MLLLTIGAGRATRTAAFGDEASPPKPGGGPASRLHVPEGFVVELVAGPPLVEHPMMACFDERGRLFVAEAAGVNLRAEALLKDPPNRIRLLEDTDGDGRFDKSTVFADRMTLPMGVLWYRGALYTASPPSLWRLEDTDGDGKADKRQELVTRFGFTGNAADIHGPFLGPDGRFYWSDGRHGHTIQRPEGRELTGKAARIFRCRPDGTGVEVVCGGGMDNPVEVAFTAEGEPLATVNILIGRPSRIDAIIYCIEGGVYPYYEPVLGEFKRSGDLLPAVGPLGWVAPAGLMRYRGGALGDDVSRQPLLRPVQRAAHPAAPARARRGLVPAPQRGLPDLRRPRLPPHRRAGRRRRQPARPRHRRLVPHRLPHVADRQARDQGGDLPGPATRRGPARGPVRARARLGRLDAGGVAPLLDDPRPAVRDRAVDRLALQGPEAVPALREVLRHGPSARARRNAVWGAHAHRSPPRPGRPSARRSAIRTWASGSAPPTPWASTGSPRRSRPC